MIIFINGSINSGKSTVAKKLAAKFDKPALVEGDNLGAFIEWMSIDEAVPINLENLVSVIRNLSRHEFTIIAVYPLSESNHTFVINSLADLKETIHVITLSPNIDKALSDTTDRQLTDWERARIRHHYKIGIPNPSFGVIVDNTNETPDETVARIYQLVQQGTI